MPTCSTSRNITLPIGHEQSSLGSARDSDSVQKQYRRANRTNEQHDSNKLAIDALTRKVEAMRRRILGGGGSSQLKLPWRGEYDPTASYSIYDIVFISTGANQGTFLCLVGGTIGVSPWIGGGVWAQFPSGLQSNWF